MEPTDRPFKCKVENNILKIYIIEEFRDSAWAYYFGMIQDAIETMQVDHLKFYALEDEVVEPFNELIFDFSSCEWADPLPLLSVILLLARCKDKGIKTQVLLPSEEYEDENCNELERIKRSNKKRFVKFICQEGFAELLSSLTELSNGNVLIDFNYIEQQSNNKIDLCYVNSTFIKAELMQIESIEKIKDYIDKKIEEAESKSIFSIPKWAVDNLLYRVKVILIETLQNIFIHAYPEGRAKYAVFYVRGREGYLDKYYDQKEIINKTLKDESKYCPLLGTEMLGSRDGCLEIFILDDGIGISRSISKKIFELDDRWEQHDTLKVFQEIFENGIRRDNQDEKYSNKGGLFLLRRFLENSYDTIRGLDRYNWVNLDFTPTKEEQYESYPGQLNDEHPLTEGLAWTIRISWLTPTDNPLIWKHWEGDFLNHPALISYQKSEPWEEEFKGFVAKDSRFTWSSNIPEPKPELENTDSSKSCYVWLPPPNLTKNEITESLVDCIIGWGLYDENNEKVYRKNMIGSKCILFIADVPVYEALTYHQALNKSSSLRAWYSCFDYIVLISKRLSVTVLEYFKPDAVRYELIENSQLAKKFINNGILDNLNSNLKFSTFCLWLRWNDSSLYWYQLSKKIHSLTFINGSIKWYPKTQSINGFLYFGQTLSDPILRDIYRISMQRLPGLFYHQKARLIPLDNLVEILSSEHNSEELIPLINVNKSTFVNNQNTNDNEIENIFLGSVFVTGQTQRSNATDSKVTDSDEGKNQRLITFHFFKHPNASMADNVPSLLFWEKEKTLKRHFDKKNGYERIGRTSIVAYKGWKHIPIPLYGENDDHKYERMPTETFRDWQEIRPYLVKTGHWNYESNHDFLTVNLMLAVKTSFLERNGLSCFLMKHFFNVLGINETELTAEGRSWWSTLKLETNDEDLEKGVLVYISHPVTDFVIKQLMACVSEDVFENVISMRKISRFRGGATQAFSPIALEKINEFSSFKITIFDDATITGRTINELEYVLRNITSKNIKSIVILDRRRLPGIGIDENSMVAYWRLDIPSLGYNSTCPLCSSIKNIESISDSITSDLAKKRLLTWIESWRSYSPLSNWGDVGIMPTSLSGNLPFKVKYGLDPKSGEQSGGDSKKLEIYRSTGLITYVTSIHTMTSRDDLAIQYCGDGEKNNIVLSNIQKIELLSSQLLLFDKEHDSKLRIKMLKELFVAVLCIEESNEYTILASLVLLLNEKNVLLGLLKQILNEEVISNKDPLNFDICIVISSIIKGEKTEAFNKKYVKIIDDAKRLLPTKDHVADIYDTLHVETIGEKGMYHDSPLIRFTSRYSGSVDIRIRDALNSLSLLHNVVENINIQWLRAEDDIELENIKDKIKDNISNVYEKVKNTDSQNTNQSINHVEKFLEDFNTKIHSRLFYRLGISDRNIRDGYKTPAFLNDELLKLVTEKDKDDSNKTDNQDLLIKVSPSDEKFPDFSYEEVWVVWDSLIKDIVHDLIRNALKYSDKPTVDNWNPLPPKIENPEKAYVWIRIGFDKQYITIMLSNSSSETKEEVTNQLKRYRWLHLYDIGGAVCYKETQNWQNESVIVTKIILPFVGCIRYLKQKQENNNEIFA